MSYSFSISVKDFATSSLMKVGAALSVIDNRANRTQTNLQNSFDRPRPAQWWAMGNACAGTKLDT